MPPAAHAAVRHYHFFKWRTDNGFIKQAATTITPKPRYSQIKTKTEPEAIGLKACTSGSMASATKSRLPYVSSALSLRNPG